MTFRFLMLSLLFHGGLLLVLNRSRPHFVPITSGERWVQIVASRSVRTGVNRSARVPGNEKGAGDSAVDERGPRIVAMGELLSVGNQPPEYPERAQVMGWEGEVTLRLEIQSTGDVREAVVQRSSGFSILDDAALRAAKGWRWPVGEATALLVPVIYELENSAF